MHLIGHGPGLCNIRTSLVQPPEVPSFPSTASLWAAWEADAPANAAAVTSINFTSSNVDASANTIDLGVTAFAANGSYASVKGTQVFFSTTGTLPGGLLANTPYYVSLVSGTLYNVYPVATDADAGSIPGFTSADNIAAGQKFVQKVGAVDLTSGGSGTHTMYTREITAALVDAVNAYRGEGIGLTDKNTWFEIDTDAQGHKYVRSGRIAKDHLGDGVYDFYGKTFNIKPNTGGANIDVKNNIGNKRIVYESFVVEIDPHVTRGNPKAPLSSSSVNTTTNIFTSTAHVLNTGDLVRIKLDVGGTLPAPLAENTDYYLRDISANTFSLHPTQGDATANTNIIDITTAGSGTFTVYAPCRVADSNKMSTFVELIEPNGTQNVLSPNLSYTGPTSVGRVLPNVTYIPSGGNAGHIYNQKELFDFGFDVVKVDVYVPPEGTGPTRQDTGLPLLSGAYWATRSPGSSVYGRLHTSEALAIAAVGVSSGSLSSTQMIKYSDTGNTEWMVNWHEDVGTPFSFNFQGVTGNDGRPYYLLPFNRKMVVTFVVDYNDPDPSVTTAICYLYIDGVLVHTRVTARTKGNLAAAATGSPGTLMNSAASHVPFMGKWYAGFFGSHASDYPTAGLDEVHAYLKAKYGIA